MKLRIVLQSLIFAGCIHSATAASASPICDWAPEGFDCNTPIQCREDWPHMTENFRSPQDRRRRVGVSRSSFYNGDDVRTLNWSRILNSTLPIIAVTEADIVRFPGVPPYGVLPCPLTRFPPRRTQQPRALIFLSAPGRRRRPRTVQTSKAAPASTVHVAGQLGSVGSLAATQATSWVNGASTIRIWSTSDRSHAARSRT